MSTKYKFHNPDGTYFVTFAVVGWVDVFTRNEYRNIVIDSLNYCIDKKGLVIHAWVIMTNHIHMIISRKGQMLLEHIMRDMKKFTSIEIIHENPVEHGFTNLSECYDWSSVIDYSGGKGLVNIEIL